MTMNDRHTAAHSVASVLRRLLKRSLHAAPEVVRSNRQLLPHVHALFLASETQERAQADPSLYGHLLCCAADFYVHEQRDSESANHFLELAKQLPLKGKIELAELAVRFEALRSVYCEVLVQDIEGAETPG